MSRARAIERVKKELVRLINNPPMGVSCTPKEDNPLALEGAILGPECSPYAGGIFRVDIDVPSEYPFRPPKVRFVTKIYHPNIDEAGNVCLDLLQMPPNGKWRCTLSISYVLQGIHFLLAHPNPLDPMVPEIGAVYIKDVNLYFRNAADYTRRYALYDNSEVMHVHLISFESDNEAQIDEQTAPSSSSNEVLSPIPQESSEPPVINISLEPNNEAQLDDQTGTPNSSSNELLYPITPASSEPPVINTNRVADNEAQLDEQKETSNQVLPPITEESSEPAVVSDDDCECSYSPSQAKKFKYH